MPAQKNEIGQNYLTEIAVQPFQEGMNIALGEAILTKDLVSEAVSLCGHKDPRIAFRVSWGLEYAYFRARDKMVPHTERLVDNYLNASNESIYRIYGKIVHDMLRHQNAGAWERQDDIAEKAFDILTDPQIKVASKVWAMEILLLLYNEIDWVAENLGPTIEHQASLSPTPAMTNHASKVLRRIKSKFMPDLF